MKYEKKLILKNGKELCLRSSNESDGREVLGVFLQTHAETDYLLSYPDECSFTVEQESAFLARMENESKTVELVAVIDGKIVGMGGFSPVGTYCKVSHRAEFGVSILKEYWGLGIGKALSLSCIECARKSGYTQLELDVVSENVRAVAMYEKLGFDEYGRNPKGFKSRVGRYQETILMRLEL